MPYPYDPQFQQVDPYQGGVPGGPMMPYYPPEVTDQAGSYPPSQPNVPPAGMLGGGGGAVPGGGGLGGMDPNMMALLQQILSAPQQNMDPRAAQIQAYMQMNQANPGRGPFTNLVNPIVNALLSRQLAPRLQEQAQSAQAMNKLKVMELVSKMGGAGLRNTKTQADIDKLNREAVEDANKYKPTPEEQQAIVQSKYKGTEAQQTQAATGQRRATTGEAGQQETAQWHRDQQNFQERKAQVLVAYWNQKMDIAKDEAERTQVQRDMENDFRRQGIEIQQAGLEIRGKQEARAAAESPVNMEYKQGLIKQMQAKQDDEEFQHDVQTIGMLGRYMATLPKNKQADYAHKNIATRLRDMGVPLDESKQSWGDWWASVGEWFGGSGPAPRPAVPVRQGGTKSVPLRLGGGTGSGMIPRGTNVETGPNGEPPGTIQLTPQQLEMQAQGTNPFGGTTPTTTTQPPTGGTGGGGMGTVAPSGAGGRIRAPNGDMLDPNDPIQRRMLKSMGLL